MEVCDDRGRLWDGGIRWKWQLPNPISLRTSRLVPCVDGLSLDHRAFYPGEKVPLETLPPPFFVLTDQGADVLSRSAPVTGIDLALDVVFESFGKRNVQGTHGHAVIAMAAGRDKSWDRVSIICSNNDPQLAISWLLLQH